MYDYITSPLYFFSLYLLPIALVLIFVSRATFNSCLKLAVWMIPLAMIYIFTTPVSFSGWVDFFPFYRDDAARLAGQVFSVVSLILIIWKYFVARRKPAV
jgi:hypothetical protein